MDANGISLKLDCPTCGAAPQKQCEMDDDVVHFAGWGDFSLTKGHFLPIKADSIMASTHADDTGGSVQH